jgi:hypothetical protein
MLYNPDVAGAGVFEPGTAPSASKTPGEEVPSVAPPNLWLQSPFTGRNKYDLPAVRLIMIPNEKASI